METAPYLDSFALGIHAMPRTNRCQHCWTGGTARHTRVPAAQLYFSLEMLAELRSGFPQATSALYDELCCPSDRPESKRAAIYLLEGCS